MKRNPFHILRRPIITEKSVDLKERTRILCFQVDVRATKVEVKEAVQAVFSDLQGKVESVHTARFHGKVRRRGVRVGRQPDWKKAYVKVKAGVKLPEYAETA